MRTHTDYMDDAAMVIKKALEGRISPMNFLLIVGFFSSLVLLYISLHVHFQTLSGQINSGMVQAEKLGEEKILLTAEHNRLTSPDRIIPLVQELGLKAGSTEEVTRIACYDNRKQFRKEAVRWAQAGLGESGTSMPGGKLEK